MSELPATMPDGTPFPSWDDVTEYAHVYHVAREHRAASNNGPGTEERPFATINRAAGVLKPGEWDSVIKTTGGRAEDPVPLLRLAGRLPDLGPESADEEEGVRILRALPFHFRQVAVWMLRGIHAEYLRGDDPRTLLGEGCC